MTPMFTGGDPAHFYSADNNDFDSGMHAVTFGPRNLMAALSIRTRSDLREEGPEVFQVVILSTDVENVVVGAASTANVTITDTTGSHGCMPHAAHQPVHTQPSAAHQPVHTQLSPPHPHSPPPSTVPCEVCERLVQCARGGAGYGPAVHRGPRAQAVC